MLATPRYTNVPLTSPWSASVDAGHLPGVVGASSYPDPMPADDITELDIEILRAIAAGHLPDQHLLTVELRRLAALGLIDDAGHAIRLTWGGVDAVQIANGERAAG